MPLRPGYCVPGIISRRCCGFLPRRFWYNLVAILTIPDERQKKTRKLDWQSEERILIKTIESNDRQAGKEPVVVIGVAAKGTAVARELKWGLFWHTTKRTDISQNLQYILINDIVRNAIFKASGVRFVDPLIWIEEINI